MESVVPYIDKCDCLHARIHPNHPLTAKTIHRLPAIQTDLAHGNGFDNIYKGALEAPRYDPKPFWRWRQACGASPADRSDDPAEPDDQQAPSAQPARIRPCWTAPKRAPAICPTSNIEAAVLLSKLSRSQRRLRTERANNHLSKPLFGGTFTRHGNNQSQRSLSSFANQLNPAARQPDAFAGVTRHGSKHYDEQGLAVADTDALTNCYKRIHVFRQGVSALMLTSTGHFPQ